MPYDLALAAKVREALSAVPDLPAVVEKKMFRGLAFMVGGKMCISVSGDELMCRIDPEEYDTAIERKGTRPMIMKGREYRGYLYVSEAGLKSTKDFEYWLTLCLNFNQAAKASPKKQRKKT